MCVSCFGQADFLLTSGIVGAASVRVAARSVLPGWLPRRRPVSDEEAAAFVAAMRRDPADGPAAAPPGGDPSPAGDRLVDAGP